MLAISAREMSPPGRKKALNWMLLCTAGTADLDSARMILNGYRLRWQIERFFDALKPGTRIHDRQLNHPDDLRKCVAFDAMTAFRVWDLTGLGRNRPDALAIRYLEREDIEVLLLLAKSHGFKIPRGPPTMATFVVLTGGLVGFHPKKCQPLPGVRTLWEGLLDLKTAVHAIRTLREQQNEEDELDFGDEDRIDDDSGDSD